MLIHHILSFAKPINRLVISNVKINLRKMKMKDFENYVSLTKKKSKAGWKKSKASTFGLLTLYSISSNYIIPIPTQSFTSTFKRENRWEEGEQVEWRSLLKFGLSKFKNIIDNTTWGKTDTLEAKFIDLSTIASSMLEAVSKINSVQKEITTNNNLNNN